ncbi:MAG: histidine--tRNA ligase [Actinomycetota bacterium]
MPLVQPRTMPGVLELLPRDQVAFQRMLDLIRAGFERFGFLPIETPTMELAEVLLTKAGGEAERQIYLAQSSGASERRHEPDLALRFDLTVPFARYVAQHQAHLTFPFRRYQIQTVFRGERPQQGRFREFYQCDIDVIGRETLSLRHDAEMPAVISTVFSSLGFGDFVIRLNNRRLLRGLLEQLGVADEQSRVLRELDKLDRRDRDEVEASLIEAGMTGTDAGTLLDIVGRGVVRGAAALIHLESISVANPLLRQGIAELTEVVSLLADLGVPDQRYGVDLSIARGLDYYTGTVYETTLTSHPGLGSICSGGRYDDLAGLYTKTRLPGVGISIGLTRVFWQLREAGLLHEEASPVTAMVALIDEAGLTPALRMATDLREGGINTETVMEPARLVHQLKHADRAGIRLLVVAGPDERASGMVLIRDLRTSDQQRVPAAGLVAAVKGKLSGDQRR